MAKKAPPKSSPPPKRKAAATPSESRADMSEDKAEMGYLRKGGAPASLMRQEAQEEATEKPGYANGGPVTRSKTTNPKAVAGNWKGGAGNVRGNVIGLVDGGVADTQMATSRAGGVQPTTSLLRSYRDGGKVMKKGC